MKLATKVHHGVAALFDLAFHGAGRAAQAREVAERQEIPVRYLEEILQELRRVGLVDARRGPRGGYALAREPAAISLADVLRALGDPADERVSAASSVPSLALAELGAKVEALYATVTLADLVLRAEALGLPRTSDAPHMYFI